MRDREKQTRGIIAGELRRARHWCIVWLVLLGLCGCATQPVVMQEIITVTGRGYAQDYVEPAIEPSSRYVNNLWAALSIEARGTAKPQAVIANPLQRKLMAQLHARSNAKRALAQKVGALPVTEDTTMGEYLEIHSALCPQVEALIRNAEITQEEELADGTWSVRAKLKLDTLAKLVEPQKLPESSEPKRKVSLTIRERAQAQAIQNARARLMNYVAGVEIQTGITISDLMRRDPEFFKFVQTRVQNAPIVDTRYPANGISEVDLEFDLGAIRAVLY